MTTILVEIVNIDGKDRRVVYGTVSYDDALQQLEKIPEYVKEGGKQGVKRDNLGNRDPDDIYNMKDSNDKAELGWENDTCVMIRLRKDSVIWYELLTVDVEDRAKWKAKKSDVDERGDRKRRKLEVEEAVDENIDIFDGLNKPNMNIP
jgi:hypothetical protein